MKKATYEETQDKYEELRLKSSISLKGLDSIPIKVLGIGRTQASGWLHGTGMTCERNTSLTQNDSNCLSRIRNYFCVVHLSGSLLLVK